MGWLVVVCETHGLDGMFFVAAHYHIAMQSRQAGAAAAAGGRGAPAAPWREALAGLPLPRGDGAVESGRVRRRPDGAPAEWEPVATVLPVSDRLRALVSGAGVRRPRRRGAGRLAFRLAEPGAGDAFDRAGRTPGPPRRSAAGRSRIRASR